MDGIRNFLQIINDNWLTIISIFLIIFAIIQKTIRFFDKTNKEKIVIIKEQIKQSMLKFVTEAEIDYKEWISAGEIKRSQVINQIYEKYPILATITDQNALIKWLDEMIDLALNTMREIFKENGDEADDEETVSELE